MYSLVWWIVASAEKRHCMNSRFARQPLPSLPAVADCCQCNYFRAAASENAAQAIRPLANPNPLPSKLTTAIAVAQGGEVCQGWGNIKVGGEWAG